MCSSLSETAAAGFLQFRHLLLYLCRPRNHLGLYELNKQNQNTNSTNTAILLPLSFPASLTFSSFES